MAKNKNKEPIMANTIQEENGKSKAGYYLASLVIAIVVNVASNIIINKMASEDHKKINEGEIQNCLENYSKYDGRLSYIEKQLDALGEINIKNSASVEPNEEVKTSLSLSDNKDDYMVASGELQNGLTSSSIIAYSKNGKELTCEDLKKHYILYPYYDKNGELVMFCGMFNEQLHWNGRCTINVYRNKELIAITEAEYDNGHRKSYRQMLRGDDLRKWNYNIRIVDGNVNHGETKVYESNDIIKQKFEVDDITGDDMYTINAFSKRFLDKDLMEYYSGDTSMGTYNDGSGKSYYVSYDDDGNILTLYYGGFKDGCFDDNTNTAWEITRRSKDPSQQENMNYMFYKGVFKNGDLIKSTGEEKTNLTKKDIERYIKGININAPLRWHI